jgi:hypothetical protein
MGFECVVERVIQHFWCILFHSSTRAAVVCMRMSECLCRRVLQVDNCISSHSFDVNIKRKGLVPNLFVFLFILKALTMFTDRSSDVDSIFMYDIAENGTATPLSLNLSPAEGDGPRNVYPSKDGKLLYVVCPISSSHVYKWVSWANKHYVQIIEHIMPC